MREWKKTRKNWRSTVRILCVLAVLAAVWVSCKSTTSTTSTTTTTTVARILVTNTYGQTLDIYMDGTFQFTLTNKNGGTITNVSIATHTMEAKIGGTTTVIDTTTVDVTSLIDYTYTIDRPDINVTNGWGETLKIYMDNVYQFTIVDQENRYIIQVTLQSHFLKATRASNDTEVASTTLNVTQNKKYSWTIQ
jgi:TRAP-type mannitol/chloroaromatic compound transport system substrate-binding protein